MHIIATHNQRERREERKRKENKKVMKSPYINTWNVEKWMMFPHVISHLGLDKGIWGYIIKLKSTRKVKRKNQGDFYYRHNLTKQFYGEL